MSINLDTLSSVQQAGQAIHDAAFQLKQAQQSVSQELITSVSAQPFSPESDRAFARMREVSRMAQEVGAMEENLRQIYGQFQLMVKEEGGSRGHIPRFLIANHQTTVQDAVVTKPKPAKVTKTADAKGKNEPILLAYLQGQLSTKVAQRITAAQAHEATHVPLGSIAASMSRLVKKGLIIESTKGHYRLP